jgi:hypothetical protein
VTVISVPARQTFPLQNMRLTTLNPSKYKRFFAFGCSFTNYNWPTWADIIGQDIPVYQNWGKIGAGNHYIFNSIIEADARYNFNKEDLVIVMWTFLHREDRYYNSTWQCDTIQSLEQTYGGDWFKKYALDRRSFLIRDLALATAAQSTIQKANWEQFWTSPITNIDKDKVESTGIYNNLIPESEGRPYWVESFDSLCNGTNINPLLENLDVIKVYKDLFLNINKTVEGRWSYEYTKSRKLPNNDQHPSPAEALAFLNSVWPDNLLSNTAQTYANQWTVNTEPVNRL